MITTSLGVVGALTIELLSFQTFLLLLGSVFVPLFGVLLADWLVAGRHYDEIDVFGAPPWRPGMIAVWVLGFAVYQWLSPTGPEWWLELVGHLDPPGVGHRRDDPELRRHRRRRARRRRCIARRAGLRALRT